MKRNVIAEFGDWLEDRLKSLCGELTPDKRFIFTLIFLIGGCVLSVYFTVSSIYNMGKENAEKEFIEIQNIKTLDLKKKESINFKNLENGTEQFGTDEDE